MTSSLPNARRNGVSPVGVRAVVLYAHKGHGCSSGHIPFAQFEQGSVGDLNVPIGLWVGGVKSNGS